MHVTGAMVCWDSGPEEGSEIAVHRWVTDDMALVEAMFAALVVALGWLSLGAWLRATRTSRPCTRRGRRSRGQSSIPMLRTPSTAPSGS